jgi:hypothetical protein
MHPTYGLTGRRSRATLQKGQKAAIASPRRAAESEVGGVCAGARPGHNGAAARGAGTGSARAGLSAARLRIEKELQDAAVGRLKILRDTLCGEQLHGGVAGRA